MKSDEARFAEAVASLTARLETWDVTDPNTKAEQFVRDMVQQGWRPRSLATVHALTPSGTPPPPLDDVRAKLKADQEAYQAQVRALRDATTANTSRETPA